MKKGLLASSVTGEKTERPVPQTDWFSQALHVLSTHG